MRLANVNIFSSFLCGNFRRHRFLIAAFVILFSLIQCSGDLVFSSLINTRLKMVVKGTLESNDPYDHRANVYLDDALAAPFDDNVATNDVKFYLDIAEIRIANGTGYQIGTDAADYWEFFARDRILLCSDYNALFSKELETCKGNDGAAKLQEFFNEGFVYPAKDVKAQSYPHLAIYFRKFITSQGRSYNSSDAELATPKATFDNRQIEGTDIEPIYNYAPGDAASTAPKMFPLERTDLKLKINNSDDDVTLEVRVFLKNIFMKHAMVVSDDPASSEQVKTRTYVGVSDWLNNYTWDDTDRDEASRAKNTLQGGHILMTARTYEPKNVGHIAITNDGDNGTGFNSSFYLVAVEAGSSYDPKTSLPLVATKGANNALLKNLPVTQSYDIYKICDLKKITSGGEAAGADGFPETKTANALACLSAPVSLTEAGHTVSVTLESTCDCQ